MNLYTEIIEHKLNTPVILKAISRAESEVNTDGEANHSENRRIKTEPEQGGSR